MKRLLLPACLLLAVLAAGCLPICLAGSVVTGSGRLATREMDLKGFSRIEAGSAFVLDVAQAEDPSASITADDNLFDYLDVSVSGDTLHLGLRPGHSYQHVTMRAQIALPTLRGLQLSGASQASVSGLRSSEDLALDLSGASIMRGDLEAGDLRVDESGASRLELTGSGGSLELHSSGASSARLIDLPVGDANVSLSGASSAELNASGLLNADLSGASRLEYTGSPTLGRAQTSGSSSISAR